MLKWCGQWNDFAEKTNDNFEFMYTRLNITINLSQRLSWAIKGSQMAKIKKYIFFTCFCHKVYMVEALGLSLSKYTLICETWGNNVKIWYFVITASQLKSKSFCTYMTHITVIITHHISFLLNQFSFLYKFSFPNIASSTVKSPNIT